MARFLDPFPQFLKLQNGALQPNTDGYLYFYVNGTSTLATVYTDNALTIPANNPQRLDSNGRMVQNVFVNTDLFRVRLGDNNDATIWDKSDFSIADPQEVDGIIAELEALIETVTADLFANNYVPNPAMQIDSLDTAGSPVSLTTSYVANVDDFACAVLSNVSAGTAGQSTTQVGRSGFSLAFTGVTCTAAGQPSIRSRIGYDDAISLSNKTLTISLVVKHDVGAAVNYTISTAVADAQDDFTTVTSTGLTSTTSVQSGVATTISLTGAFENITNGLQIIVTAVPNQALTAKSFYWSDVGCYPAGVVLPFNVPLYFGQNIANEITAASDAAYGETIWTTDYPAGAFTFTKADVTGAVNGDTLLLEGWGGGASGGVSRGAAGAASGGEGGTYVSYSMRWEDVPATITGTVGAKGAAVARSSDGFTNGNAGGDTTITIGSLSLVANGGAAGSGTATGSTTVTTTARTDVTVGGMSVSGQVPYTAGNGGSGNSAAAAGNGSPSVFGGGGGGGAGKDGASNAQGTGGSSVRGGVGGAGAAGSGAAQTGGSGVSPGGGGGGASGATGYTHTSGAGADGLVRVTVIKGWHPVVLGAPV